MCTKLGADWLKQYETFYRFSSVPTHAGRFTLGSNYKQLLEHRQPSNWERAVVLTTAPGFHLGIGEVAAKVFPDQIMPEAIMKFRSEIEGLGQSLKQE